MNFFEGKNTRRKNQASGKWFKKTFSKTVKTFIVMFLRLYVIVDTRTWLEKLLYGLL